MAIERKIQAALASALLLAAGCGGDDEGRPKPQAQPQSDASLDPCMADDGFELQPIATFEPSDPTLASWSASNDGTWDEIDPPASPPAPLPTPIGVPRCGESEFALHLRAVGLKIWGAALGANLGSACVPAGTATGCDASEWDGLALWARRDAEFTDDAGVAHRSGRTLFVSTADRYSHGNLGHCVWDHVRDEEKCDRFGLGVGLDTEWRFYAIRFDAMKQRGFGKPSPTGQLDRVLYDVNFGVEAGDWEIWLDDVSLFREPRPDR